MSPGSVEEPADALEVACLDGAAKGDRVERRLGRGRAGVRAFGAGRGGSGEGHQAGEAGRAVQELTAGAGGRCEDVVVHGTSFRPPDAQKPRRRDQLAERFSRILFTCRP